MSGCGEERGETNLSSHRNDPENTYADTFFGRETGPWERPHTDQPRYFVFRVFNYNEFDWCSSWGHYWVLCPVRYATRASNSTTFFCRYSILTDNFDVGDGRRA